MIVILEYQNNFSLFDDSKGGMIPCAIFTVTCGLAQKRSEGCKNLQDRRTPLNDMQKKTILNIFLSFKRIRAVKTLLEESNGKS